MKASIGLLYALLGIGGFSRGRRLQCVSSANEKLRKKRKLEIQRSII